HSKVILALAVLLAIAAPLYNVASAGPGWTLAGMLYADVAAAGFAAYALRRQSLAYIAGALLTVPYALTLHLVGVTSEQWAIPWAGLAVAYFTGSIVLRRYPSIAGPLISLSYVLTAAALIWAAFDSTGVMARWTLPLVVAIYCASAFLIHRGRISTRLKILAPVYGGLSVSGEDRGRESVVVTFILAVAVIAPVWTALMLAWLGVEGSVHGVSLLAWAFLFGAVGHLVLRRTSITYNYALLGAGIIAALVAVSVSLVYGDRTVTTGVLYGVSALAFLYHFYIRSEFPLYVALVLLLAPMGMTLDLLGLEALMWGTPLMVLAVAYLGTGLLMQRRRRTKAFATLYEVGFVMSGVALAWTVFWVAVTSLELARAENITLLAQRLLASATLFLGAGAYIVAAYRREDRTFGYLASIVMAGAIGLVIMATPLNLRHATIAVAAIGAAYVLIGSWGLRARMSNRTGSEDDIIALPTPGARLATAFRWPLIATGYFIASVSLLIATYDLTDGSGQVLPANMVYLINVALLAAHARVARASGLAYGAVLLFVLPFTLTVYDLFGETNDLAVFPSAALSFGWVGLALAYIGLGQLAERIRGKHALALIAPGYALLIASVLPALGSAERQSVVFGAIVAVAAVSAFLVHRGAAPHTIEYVATKLSWPLQIARRHLVTGLIAVAALLSPLWSLEVLALFTREAPIQGLVLALEAPLFLLVGTLIFKRIDRLYAWTVLFAAYGMSVIAVLFTLNDEVIRLVTLLAATAVFGASLAIFRRGEWLYPLLISAHLSVVAFLTLPQLDISQPVMGIIFVPITLGMAVGLGISMRDAKDKNIKVMLKPWTTPFILFGVVDLSASLVLAAGENWAGFVVTITYAIVTAIGAYISRNRLAPYVSTVFLTLSVMFASRMFGLSWSQSAIVWATQGFIMWWMSQTANALSRRGSPEGVPRAELAIWVNPLRSSGIRLSWFALAFVVAVFFFGLYTPDRFGAAQVDDATAVVSILGLLYLGIAFVGRRPLFGYLAVGLLLISWLIQLGDREIPFAQAYAIPAGLYLLGIAFFERRRSPGRLAAFIDMAAVLVLVVSAFWQSVTDDTAWAYALLTGVDAVLLVFWGALNRTKVPFFGGIAAFILNVLYQSTALLSTLPGAVTGLVIGIVLVALIVVIEWRRQQLVALGKKWSGRLDDWAW
ncbi:MAG: hypothetical protein IIC85_12755, partial [Chloroflexi bacterium]|nr:hypothetical protein [Chloroflexota bacterium]